MLARSARVLLVLACLVAEVVSPPRVDASLGLCATTTIGHFLGDGISVAGLNGVYSEIENISEQLCTQPTGQIWPSWSLSWVSLDGNGHHTSGINIYQGGYATCPAPPGNNCPWNNGNRYIWYFYSRDTSDICGVTFNTTIVKVQDATVYGTHFFQVSKVGSNYNFYVDETLKYQRTVFDVETCWAGISQAEWKDEILNINDQAGGHIANAQNFGNNQYHDAAGWHNRNRTLGSNCVANSYPLHWHCHQSTTTANYFIAWDDRVP